MIQTTFSQIEQNAAKIKTRKQRFLEDMEKVIPWDIILEKLSKAYYVSGKVGRQPYPLETMIRIYLIQQWNNLSDLAAQEYLVDVPVARNFAKIRDINKIPDQNTILNFRHFLEENNYQDELFNCVKKLLEEKGLLGKEGTIVDATIIEAPRSTKNKENKRDEEMSSTKKSSQWHYGAKAHCGVDKDSGLVHSYTYTTAKEHDSKQFYNLLHGTEKKVYGDRAYTSKERSKKLKDKGIEDKIQRKVTKNSTEEEREEIKKVNNELSKVRCKVEHVFGVIKSKFNYRKTRYKGLRKNALNMTTLLALANLYMAREALLKTI